MPSERPWAIAAGRHAAGGKPRHDGGRVVAAAVVDEDDLVGRLAERRGDLGEEFGEILRFVPRRHDDRDLRFVRRSHARAQCGRAGGGHVQADLGRRHAPDVEPGDRLLLGDADPGLRGAAEEDRLDPRIDEGDAAAGLGEEIGRRSAVDEPDAGADGEDQARLLIPGGNDGPIAAGHVPRERGRDPRRQPQSGDRGHGHAEGEDVDRQRRDGEEPDAGRARPFHAARIAAAATAMPRTATAIASGVMPPPKRSIATTRRDRHEDAADGSENRRSAGEEPAAGKAVRRDGAAEKRGDGRIDRQRIVRQLGDHGLEDEEARDEPGEAEADSRIAALAPDPLRRRRQEGGGRPEDEPEEGEMRPGRGGMALLAAAELAEEIVPDRLADEVAAGDRRGSR